MLTCDVLGSRKFETDRFTDVLRKCVDETNAKFSSILHRKFRIMFGDSIQCVITEPSLCFNVFEYFEENLWLSGANEFTKKQPVMIRCGIGLGTVDNPDDTLGVMTGDAFEFARVALESISKEKRKSKAVFMNYSEIFSNKISIMMAIACALKSSWNFSQRRCIWHYRQNDSIVKTADLLGISHQFVSEALFETNYEELVGFEQIVKEFMAQHIKGEC